MANPLPHIFQQLSVQGPMSDLDDNFNALIGNVQGGAYMLAQDIGSANAYAATITPVPVAYQAGMIIVLQNIIAANTGASTFNLNGLGALPILKSANNALTGGEVIAGSLAVLVLNGTSAWHLIYASANFNPGPNSVFSSGSQFYGASTFDTMPQVGGALIIESGSNTNGSYVKYADGTMMCRNIASLPTGTGTLLSTAFGFPLAFYSPPIVSGVWNSSAAGVLPLISLVQSITTTSCVVFFGASGGSFDGSTKSFGYIAHGRWKA